MSKASQNRDLLTFDMYRPEKLSDCIFSFRVFEEEIKSSYIELSSDFNDFGENIVEVSAININTWIRFMRMKLVFLEKKYEGVRLKTFMRNLDNLEQHIKEGDNKKKILLNFIEIYNNLAVNLGISI